MDSCLGLIIGFWVFVWEEGFDQVWLKLDCIEMEGDDHGRRASSSAKPSRLSPLAEPFSSNRSNTALPPLHTLTSVDPCASMPKLLSGINLEDDPFQLASVFSHDPFDFGENSCFLDYPSANASSDFGSIPSAANESLLDCTEHSSFGHSQASLSSNKSAALAYETVLELGNFHRLWLLSLWNWVSAITLFLSPSFFWLLKRLTVSIRTCMATFSCHFTIRKTLFYSSFYDKSTHSTCPLCGAIILG